MAFISGARWFFFLHCLAFAFAGVIPNVHQLASRETAADNATYDAIIVGGGPAGLSALSGLSRVQRKALLFDSGEYRNAPTRNMHDVIGNDGTPPSAFRALARKQILGTYNKTASIKDVKVQSITPIGNGSLFSVTDVQGNTYTAKKIVLGTGMKDDLPATPGIEDAWGKGMYWCPWCDGYEHRDQPLGVLGPLPDVLSSVYEVHTLNTDIIALVNGTQTPEQEEAARQKNPKFFEILQAYNVTIENRTIASIERLQDGSKDNDPSTHEQFDKFRVHFTDGGSVDRGAFLTNFPSSQRSTLPAQLELKMQGNKIYADVNSARTSLKGVWAVGDANSDGSTNVPHAMYSGKKSAVYIHVEISREEAQSLVSKRGLLLERELEEDAWKRIGNDLDDLWEKTQAA